MTYVRSALQTANQPKNSLGSTEAVSSHLQGLARIKELQGEERRPKKMGLFQRMIAM